MQEDAAALPRLAGCIVVDEHAVVVLRHVADEVLVRRRARPVGHAGVDQPVVVLRAGGSAPVVVLRDLGVGQVRARIGLDSEGRGQVEGPCGRSLVALLRLSDAVLPHVGRAGMQLLPRAALLLMDAQLRLAAALVLHQNDLICLRRAAQLRRLALFHLYSLPVRYLNLHVELLLAIADAQQRAARLLAGDRAALGYAGYGIVLHGVVLLGAVGQRDRLAHLHPQLPGQHHHAAAGRRAAAGDGDHRAPGGLRPDGSTGDRRDALVGAAPGQILCGQVLQLRLQRHRAVLVKKAQIPSQRAARLCSQRLCREHAQQQYREQYAGQMLLHRAIPSKYTNSI